MRLSFNMERNICMFCLRSYCHASLVCDLHPHRVWVFHHNFFYFFPFHTEDVPYFPLINSCLSISLFFCGFFLSQSPETSSARSSSSINETQVEEINVPLDMASLSQYRTGEDTLRYTVVPLSPLFSLL